MTVVSGADVIATTGKRSPQNARDLRLIIDHQNAFLFGHEITELPAYDRSGRLLRDNMDIHGWRIPKKFVDGIQVQVSLPAFHRGMPENDLGDVFLSDESGNRF